MLLLHAQKTFHTAYCSIYFYLCLLQKPLYDFQVHIYVVNYQNLCIRSRKKIAFLIRSIEESPISFRKITNRFIFYDTLP